MQRDPQKPQPVKNDSRSNSDEHSPQTPSADSSSRRSSSRPSNSRPSNSRREFLKKASAAAAAVGATARGQLSAAESNADDNPLFQPQEYWQDRITPPADGKKYAWFIDTRRCFGCHGCEVSCKSENDVPLGKFIRQTFYKDVGEFPKVARMFMPMACQHCEDAPCIKACPCGALEKGTGGSVIIDYETCCGHATCVDVCPYGAIYIDPVANQAVKCHNCYHRLEHDMEPACANTCPADAIYFGDLNDPESKVSKALAEAKSNDIATTQLRSEKNTKPRMWFAGDAPVHIEERVPREGESYNPETYSIYNWKENRTPDPNVQ